MKFLVTLLVACVLAVSSPALAQSSISGGGVGYATGDSILVVSGTCPSGFTEATAARGRFLVHGASGATVGATLGTALSGNIPDASYTPVGTNATSTVTPLGTNATSTVTPLGTNSAPTFTGSALTTHQHLEISSAAGAGSVVSGRTASFGTGTAETMETIASTSNTSINRALTEAVSAGTPAGTVSAPTFTGSSSTVAAQTFTGSSSTVAAQAFTGTANATMRSVTAPYIQVLVCTKS